MAKAVERVETRASTQRSSTRLSETEEKNLQVFDNKDGKTHISGMYRWIDKEYTAQVFNYGRRMMFEFVVPEPAAFWVESRLAAHAGEIVVPQPPAPPVYQSVALGFGPADVDEAKLAELRQKYDLSGIPPLVREKMAVLVNQGNGTTSFTETAPNASDKWFTRTYGARITGG
ncbi:hypothetical protein Acor_33600 [Acrocarpospora corrugata]|uniref:Uncharacterized protein n=1 Tax=Acrocarpospora corrugata TaxID=35763 RepID=A0A5M3VXP3_9ACTN|nr:hypothetical protein Acor_33600 [Acrocarpospora corrugata]